MAWSASIRVYGKAAAQGSKRHVGNGVMVEMCKRLKPWRREVQDAMLAKAPAKPIDGPFLVDLEIYVPRPKTHFRTNGLLKPNAPLRPKSGLDLDKIQRAIGDAGSAIWWTDDARIVSWGVDRLYSEDGREWIDVHAQAPEVVL